MNIFSSFKMAVHALWINKVRSLLTLLGIVIGISSMVMIVASGEGVQKFILDEIQGFGTNIISITPGGSEGEMSGPPAIIMGVTITTLTLDDAEAIANKRNVPDVLDVGAFSPASQVVVKGPEEDRFSTVYGTTPNYFDIMNLEFAEGSSYTDDDVRSLRKVVVLGSGIKEKLFGDEAVVGEKIKLRNYRYTIVGVTEESSSAFGFASDDMIYIPVTVAQKFLLGLDYLMEIIVRVVGEDRVDQARLDVESVLRDRHGISDPKNDDFTVRTTKDALDMITLVTDALTLFLAAIAAISLLVGGIGIMNIMLVSVSERTKEIGLRKALGARRKDILMQFLIEAITLTFIGGLIGFILGISGAFVASLVGGWEFHISLMAIILPLIMIAFFGIVFGVYPAIKASKLDPIVALRYE